MSLWESIDELLGDENEVTSSTSTSYEKYKNYNEDELDQNELLGIIDEEASDDFADEFGLNDGYSTSKHIELEVKQDSCKMDDGNLSKQGANEEAKDSKCVKSPMPNETSELFTSSKSSPKVQQAETTNSTKSPQNLNVNKEILMEKTSEDTLIKEADAFNSKIESQQVTLTTSEENELNKSSNSDSSKEVKQQHLFIVEDDLDYDEEFVTEEHTSTNKETKVDEEEEDEEEDEDENGVKIRARSNHWSERKGESKANEAKSLSDANRDNSKKPHANNSFNNNGQNSKANTSAANRPSNYNNRNNNNNKQRFNGQNNSTKPQSQLNGYTNKYPLQSHQHQRPNETVNLNGNGLLPLPTFLNPQQQHLTQQLASVPQMIANTPQISQLNQPPQPTYQPPSNNMLSASTNQQSNFFQNAYFANKNNMSSFNNAQSANMTPQAKFINNVNINAPNAQPLIPSTFPHSMSNEFNLNPNQFQSIQHQQPLLPPPTNVVSPNLGAPNVKSNQIHQFDQFKPPQSSMGFQQPPMQQHQQMQQTPLLFPNQSHSQQQQQQQQPQQQSQQNNLKSLMQSSQSMPNLNLNNFNGGPSQMSFNHQQPPIHFQPQPMPQSNWTTHQPQHQSSNMHGASMLQLPPQYGKMPPLSQQLATPQQQLPHMQQTSVQPQQLHPPPQPLGLQNSDSMMNMFNANQQPNQQASQMYPPSLQQQVQHPTIMMKPSTIYLNPSFVAKQQQKLQGNVLQDNKHHNNNTENTNYNTDNKKQEKATESNTQPSTQSIQATKSSRSRKEMELLLEKRLASLRQIENENENKNENEKKISIALTNSSTVPSAKTQTVSKRKSNDTSQAVSSKIIKPSLTPSKNDSATTEPTQTANRKLMSKVVNPNTAAQQEKVTKTVVSPPSKPSTTSTHATTASSTTSKVIVIDDPDYAQKLEEQKRKREEILRAKEEKRNKRVLEMKKSDETSSTTSTTAAAKITSSPPPTSATQSSVVPKIASNIRNVIASTISSGSGQRIITTTNSTISLNSNSNGIVGAKKLIIQNLSLNTTDKSLITMCNKINLKDQVIKVQVSKNEAEIYFSDKESANKFLNKYNRTLVDLSMITIKVI